MQFFFFFFFNIFKKECILCSIICCQNALSAGPVMLSNVACEYWNFAWKQCMCFKGTNGRQKTYEISHVYSIFYSGFMCQTTVFFWNNERWKSVLNTLASWNCFTCRNLVQNGVNDMSECLTFETAFCKKA